MVLQYCSVKGITYSPCQWSIHAGFSRKTVILYSKMDLVYVDCSPCLPLFSTLSKLCVSIMTRIHVIIEAKQISSDKLNPWFFNISSWCSYSPRMRVLIQHKTLWEQPSFCVIGTVGLSTFWVSVLLLAQLGTFMLPRMFHLNKDDRSWYHLELKSSSSSSVQQWLATC